MLIEAKVKEIERLDITDLEKEGYVEKGVVVFKVTFEIDNAEFICELDVKLDKDPELMLKEFLETFLREAYAIYEKKKYFVANKKPPEDLEIGIVNQQDVKEKMLFVFEEIRDYTESKKLGHLRTKKVGFS